MKRGFKIPTRVKNSVSETPSRAPQTVEDWIEQGATEEESGDRWIGSDLSKGLRFYQKAYISYNEAIRLSEATKGGVVDCYYNSSRLLFLVYNNYTKQEGVHVSQLENVNDAISGDYAVVQTLSNVVRAHERAFEVARSTPSVPLDLIYNTALVYTEQIETYQDNNEITFNEVISLGSRTQDLFENLLQQQTKSFQRFLQELNEGETETEQPAGIAKSEVEGDEFESEESLQPPDIFDNILSGYKLVQAILENISNPQEQTPICIELVQPFLSNLNAIEGELVLAFSEANNSNSMIESISEEQLFDSMLLKKYIEGLLLNDSLDELFSLWDDTTLPSTPARYMMSADNIQAFLDRNDVSLDNLNSKIKIEVYWKSLTKMNQYYKFAQEKLQLLLQDRKQKKVDQGIGTLISQISDIIIARSDIDIQRCQIENYEPAVQNQQILLNNCKAFLKNAVAVANQSGGLRERVSEKLLREKRKVDAVLRLCLIEGKISHDELDTIVGRSRWVIELPGLVKTRIFRKFGIETIEVPSFF